MKILIITPAFSGGSWVCIERLIENLKRKYKISIIGLGKVVQTINNVEIKNIPYPRYDRWARVAGVGVSPFISFAWNLPLLVLSIIKLFSYKPDLIIINGFTTGLLISPLANLLKIKTVVSFHGFISGHLSGIGQSYARLLARSVDLAIVNSEGAKDDVSLIMSSDRIIINEHFADDIFFKGIIKKHKFKKLIISYVGRLDIEKLCRTLVDIAEDKQNDSRFEFNFAGVGELEERVISLTKKSKNIHYLGYIKDRLMLKKLYEGTDILWTYADVTYLALPAIEALACGVPIMVTDKSVVPNKKLINKVNKKLVPKEIGWLIDANKKDDILRIMEKIAENPSPYSMKENCRRYAMKKYSKFNLHSSISKINSLIMK